MKVETGTALGFIFTAPVIAASHFRGKVASYVSPLVFLCCEMTSEFTRLRDRNPGWNREDASCIGSCRKSGSCVTLVVVLGCLTFVGILLAIAVLERPAEPKDHETLPGESAGSSTEQCRLVVS